MPTRFGLRVFFAAALLLSVASGTALAQGQKITPDNRPATAEEKDNPQARSDWFLRGRTYNGKPAPQLLHKAYQQKMDRRAAQQRSRTAQANTTTSTSGATTGSAQTVRPNFISTTNGPSWAPLGPAPSGTASPGDPTQDYGPAIGRTTVVVVDQTDATGNTVYIGGASGGLWKSTNAADTIVQNCNTVSYSSSPNCAPGVTWTPLIDQQASLTVGAMAIKPDNNQWLLVGTGEANNSADSYYGLGFLLSKDGGSTWTLISSATAASGTGSIDLHGLGTTRIAFNTDNPNQVVATMAGASLGISIGAEFASSGSNTPRGIYFSADAGQTWQQSTIVDPRGTIQPGSANTVVYDTYTKTFYADIRWHGVYSSTDGGHTFTLLSAQPGGATLNISANCPVTPQSGGGSCPLYRSDLTIVPGRAGSSGKGEMYMWIVDVNDNDKGIYQTLDGGATWTLLSTTGIDSCGDGTNGFCGTTQGSYNMSLLAIPNGTGTDVWAGAVNEYRCTLSSPASPSSCSFTNLTHTYGDCGGNAVGSFSYVHPDEHGIDFVQSKPALIYFGNDGGVYRSLNGFNNTTKSCNSINQPFVQFDNLSGNMGSMLQMVWFSQHPSDTATFIGGTQDNGSMARNGSSTTSPYGFGYSWQTINNGDGGFNDINPTNPNEWFTSTPEGKGYIDVEQCINSSGISCTTNGFTQIVNQSALGGDTASFYMPFMLDPQAANHILAGTCRLWRVDRGGSATSWGSGVQMTYNLDNFATQGTFACSGSAVNDISAIAAGGPCKGVCNSGTNGTGNGSQVIYVGTTNGELFVTTNADGGPSTWTQVSSASGFVNNSNTAGCLGTSPCGYPISGIALDPKDPTGNTAFVTVMGFKTGHVFMTTNGGTTWTALDGTASGAGLPDNPADAVIVDPNTKGLVYAATDVGVFSAHTDPADPSFAIGSWTEVGVSSGTGALPNVATTALHIFGTGASTRLRVSTYGRGVWDIPIPNTPGFQLALTPASATVNVNLGTSVFNGTIRPFNGYNSAVNISCNAPANVTCTPSVAQVATSSGAANFTVSAVGSVEGDYTLTVVATGTDTSAVTEQQTLTLHVVTPQGLSLSTPAAANAPAGGTASTSFNVTSMSGFSGNVNLACSGLPAGAGPCTFNPAIPNLPNGGTVNVSLTIPTGTAAASSTPYPFTITASSPNSKDATADGSLQVTDFSLTGPATPVSFNPALTATFKVTVSSNSGFLGVVNLMCTAAPAWSSGCTFTDPNSLQQITSVNLTASTQSITVNVSLPVATNGTPASGTVTVQAYGGGLTHSQNVSLQTSTANSLQVTDTTAVSPFIVKAGQTLSAGVSVASSYGTTSTPATVKITCAITPASAAGGSTCNVNPTQLTFTSSGTQAAQPVTVSVNTFNGIAANPSVTVIATDAANSATTSSGDPFNYSVTDYSASAASASPILPSGSVSVPVTLSPLNGYTGTVTANCVVQGTPLNCVLSPVGPYAVSGTASVPVTATISGPGATNNTASGNYTVTVQTSDAGFATLAHNATIPVTVQDYKLTTTDSTGSAKTTATVTAGQSATFVVNVVAQAGGFTGTASFDPTTVCSNLPSKTTCALSANSAAANGSVTLTITTTAATTASARPLPRSGAPLFAFWTMLPGAFGIVVLSTRKKSKGAPAMGGPGKPGFGLPGAVLLLIGVTLLVTMIACGGGGGGSTTTPPPVPIPGTPAGTYTVTVSSSTGSGTSTMTRSTQVTLTVQ